MTRLDILPQSIYLSLCGRQSYYTNNGEMRRDMYNDCPRQVKLHNRYQTYLSHNYLLTYDVMSCSANMR